MSTNPMPGTPNSSGSVNRKSNPRRVDGSKLAIFLLIGLGAAFIIYAALNWFEIVDTKEWIGAQGEAKTNPYFAMRRVLDEMGAKTIPIERSSGLDNLPAGSTLMLGDRRLSRMSARRVKSIISWVESGGHLIVEAEQPGIDDPILAAFGIGHVGLRWDGFRFHEVREKNNNKNKPDQKDKPDSEDDENEISGVDVRSLPQEIDEPGDKKPPKSTDSEMARALKNILPKYETSEISYDNGANFTVSFKPYQNLTILAPAKTNANLQIQVDEVGMRIAQLQSGKGRVTILSNFDFMTWRRLIKDDNAEFLWHLIADPGRALLLGAEEELNSEVEQTDAKQTDGKPAVAAIEKDASATQPVILLALQKIDGGGMWPWLMQHAWMVLIAAITLLMMWLLRIVARFGPLPPLASHARLSLSEHLSAMGRYIGGKQAWAALIRAARERFMNKLTRHHPALMRLDVSAQIAGLHSLTGMGEARIQRALLVEIHDRRSFAEAIRTLKAMEMAMEAKVRSTKTKALAKSIQPS